ncbi:rhamnogalacturonan acetylesterase [Dysgonomonas sp. 521]|uniref:rhamnogalacturonan acetylesterase n=1 Tax=Dysgonomonas sp. 521 TaxID=2302932 RepID=UPI0013D00528|nr:rhamnogalacturonan acetylesterase [Dysgonomonas sp. 521]
MMGDSTMANKLIFKVVNDNISGDSIFEPFPEKGWGQLLPAFLTENVQVKNYAKNGRSSRTFIGEGLWQQVIDGLQSGDYLVIQFGHNDASKEKVDRYTTPEEYVRNFTMFVQEAKAKGAKPIICTSVARRRFDQNGTFQDSHGEYLDLARNVAISEGIPMIDMYEKSKEVLTRLGDEKSKSLFLHLKPGENLNFPEGKIDNTHFNERGALLMASLFLEGLKEQNITELTGEIKE